MKTYTDIELKEIVEKRNDEKLNKLYAEYAGFDTETRNALQNNNGSMNDKEIYEAGMKTVALRNALIEAIEA